MTTASNFRLPSLAQAAKKRNGTCPYIPISLLLHAQALLSPDS